MIELEDGALWFLAQVKPNGHHIAERNLSRQGFPSFLPMEEATRRRRGRFVNALRPLFPGYIFIAFDPEHGLWRKVNSTLGIARLVSFGKSPAPVPNALVDGLRARCTADGTFRPAAPWSPGDSVKIARGPFAEFVGTVERLAPDNRVFVLLDLMGRRTRMTVDADKLRTV
ncbi:MAG: transcription termination/antitermination protein NusG [Minwuia sp.]|uniref:transcription termination/antitermination protein NusG n=1 Tax=Minwuia sp. TaxID=2493630 RepID=UPI003A85666A